MYLGSPRMAEMVIGEKVTLEEMGGARMHTGVSGCAHQLWQRRAQGIAIARPLLLLSALQLADEPPASAAARRAPAGAARSAS